MASNFPSLTPKMFTLFFTILILFLSHPATAVREVELYSMLTVLRASGYNLFSNAVATTDIYQEILAGDSFTFFAPTDTSLFALDMTAAAADYIAALRYHVVPCRLSPSDLRWLPSGTALRTLFGSRDIHFQRRPSSDVVTVDSVDVVLPGLFGGRDIAVHGLRGILNYRSEIDLYNRSSLPPPPLGANHRYPPCPRANLYGNHGSGTPVAEHHYSPPPQEKFPDHCVSEPPFAGETGNYAVVSPLQDPASFNQLAPSKSLAITDLLSPENSTSPTLSPITEPSSTSPSVDDMRATPREGWNPMQPLPLPEMPWPFDYETLDYPWRE